MFATMSSGQWHAMTCSWTALGPQQMHWHDNNTNTAVALELVVYIYIVWSVPLTAV
jgi:hypothetical protein